jgi:hypothetical protein
MVADERLGIDTSVETVTYLAHAVAVTHESHFVPAASTEAQPTWRVARDRLRRDADLRPADLHRAHETLGWAASLRPRRTDSGADGSLPGARAADR